jgi:hypothetical protein
MQDTAAPAATANNPYNLSTDWTPWRKLLYSRAGCGVGSAVGPLARARNRHGARAPERQCRKTKMRSELPRLVPCPLSGVFRAMSGTSLAEMCPSGRAAFVVTVAVPRAVSTTPAWINVVHG